MLDEPARATERTSPSVYGLPGLAGVWDIDLGKAAS
jgi:hypothetical protein